MNVYNNSSLSKTGSVKSVKLPSDLSNQKHNDYPNLIISPELPTKILDNEKERYCEIYKITNIINGKLYIGQAVSHILNHGRYRPYGRNGRFKCHISEAFSNKKHQSQYLNNAIKKYGIKNFKVELISNCNTENANDYEIFYIKLYNSTFPNGYNLNYGGKVIKHTDESKKRVSQGLKKYYKTQKFDRFKNIIIPEENIENYIKPLRKEGNQYGWYVYINKKKADFGGIHISLDESYNEAKQFIIELKKRQVATHLDAGNPLELSTTTST